jgi:prepilin signal peptidase PulO-like enzyme (type II secretory pathway)
LFWLTFYYNNTSFSIINLFDFIIIYIILSSVIWLIYSIFNMFTKTKQKQIIPFVPAMIFAFWWLIFFADFFIKLPK